MAKHLENKLTMYNAVQTLLDANAPKVSVIPAYASTVARFKTCVAAIQGRMVQINLATKGKTMTKWAAEDDLIASVLRISAAVFANASATRNIEVKAQSDVRGTHLRRLRDMDLVGKASAIHSVATEWISDLEPYGVSLDDLNGLKLKIETYERTVGERDSGVNERVALRKTMLELFDEADRLLEEEIDRIMEVVKSKELQFFDAYRSARLIHEMGAPRVAEKPATEPAVAK